MSATPDHYDVIVIGSGPGGASLAQRLAATGKRILMLERGGYLPRSRDNWDARTVFVDGAYQAKETWYGGDGSAFHPGLHYYVGGNSKVYGAALFRLRERDFSEVRHKDGISPAWPLGYDAFEPYYTQAEALYHVHGQRGEDPNEPWSSAPYAYPPVRHEPRIQGLNDILVREGLHPFHLPLGIKLDQNPDGSATPYSPCIRCDAFDGFPCAINAKADAQVICVDPTRAAFPNFTLLTNAYVTRLETDASGRSVSRVHVIRDNQFEQYSADIVVAACGALSSRVAAAALVERRASERPGQRLGPGRAQLHAPQHVGGDGAAEGTEPHRVPEDPGVQRLLLSAADDWRISLGPDPDVRDLARRADPRRGAVAGADAFWLPEMPFDKMAEHSIDFWLQSEDLPRPENRISYDGDRVVLDIHEGNLEAARRCAESSRACWHRWRAWPRLIDRGLYLGKDIPIGGTAHQAGTCRFGTDPATSVLDLDCKAHELDNLYIDRRQLLSRRSAR